MEFFTLERIMAIISAVVIAATLVATLVMLPKLKTFWPGFSKYRHLLMMLVSRDLKVKYRRSALGFLWSILNPLLMMLVLTAVFSNLFGRMEDFPVFYITGAFIYTFVTEATSGSLGSIINSSNLLKKVYIPKYIFPLEKNIFAFVNMLFSLVAVAIVYMILRAEIHPTILLFFVPMIYAAIFAFGLSLILASANVFFRDITHLWGVWTTAWMYLTPIIYPMDILPGFMQAILKFNPLVYYVEYARSVMIYGTIPGISQNLICLGFGVTTLLIGLIMFKKTQDRFILHV
jgi:ABC-2 type transport system permease protein